VTISPDGIVPTTQEAITFTVYGEAKPAGSKRAFVNPKTGKPIVTDVSGKAGRTWRSDVKAAAVEAMDGRPPFDGPLSLSLVIYRERPRSHYGTGRNAGIVKSSAPDYPTTRPDLTKLLRGIEDALSGIVYRDDSLIVDQHVVKRFGQPAVVVGIELL
jgi:Holliday junction resolvase RusA-like endonuclease